MVSGAPQIQTSKTSSAYRLARAAKYADQAMERLRRVYRQLVLSYLAPYHAVSKADKDPFNSVYQDVQAVLPLLELDPGAVVYSRVPDNTWFGNLFGRTIDQVCLDIELAETLRIVTMSALSGMGISYTSLSAPEDDARDGSLHDAALPAVDAISIDDYLPDPFATHWSKQKFEGHAYVEGYEAALESPHYDSEKIRQIGPESKLAPDQTTADMNRPAGMAEDRFEPVVRLRTFYLRDEKRIVILPADLEQAKSVGYVGDIEWQGTENGPYDRLILLDAPDAMTLGMSPSVSGMYLGDLINTLVRKVGRQAERIKDVTLYSLGAEKDADVVKGAGDGAWIGVTDPSKFNRLPSPGVNEVLYKAIEFLEANRNRKVGNVDAIGGLGNQSKTATQDQMLYSSASAKLAFWRRRIRDLARRVMRKIGWWLWLDPAAVRNVPLDLGGDMAPLPMEWTPDRRVGRFVDYEIDVSPYGLASDTPEQRYERLLKLLVEVILPMGNLAAAQGQALDPNVVLAALTKYADVPDLDGAFRAMPMPVQQAQLPSSTSQTTVNAGGPARPSPMPGGQARMPAAMGA